MHKKRIMIIVILVILVVIFAAAVNFVPKYQHTSAARLKNKYDGQIVQVRSAYDKDNDGIDDLTDILEGAIAYTETKPKYKSKYYTTGYPDDGYGVCTDLVANACLTAGYDLMELVSEDVAANPDDYDIEAPDANIDFRRVKNLKVYFDHTAISLTTDVHDIQQWQGGDIVLFKNHIGIVSDRRNENGVTYVIHHNDPWQTRFEEDIFEMRGDITGHYRVSE